MDGDWLLLPVRPFEDGKHRLAEALSPTARAALNARLFGHVLAVAIAAVGAGRCGVVTRSGAIRAQAEAAGALGIADAAADLNGALADGARLLFARGARRVTVLHCDLPLLAQDDIAALLAAPGDVALAPDVAGTGTNALRLETPGAIPYRFGAGSRGAHVEEARLRALRITLVERPGLACDLDTPADLALLER